MDYKLLQIDENMKICFSESEDFKPGEEIAQEWTGKEKWQSFNQNGNHLLLAKGKMGFYYALAVPLSIYNKEISIWQERMLIIMAVSFAIFYSIVIAIYHMIVKPIQKLKQEIEKTGKGNFERIEDDIGIEEFHQVLAGINTMREDIKELQEKEKKEEELRKKIEIEKLMYQINPHFVLNTLYSIQWMAQRDGNTEIREFVHNLTAILSYNLGKEKTVSSLRTEVEIAKKYIEIQKQRYDFEVRMEVEEGSYLDAPTIRMLIQPLIENALQHGLGTVGKLELWIFSDPYQNYAVIIVRDYGEGLSREKIRELNQPLGTEEKQRRSGIGLRYVRYMLETFYGENAILNINSVQKKGTKVTILIPILKEKSKGEKNFD
ncbi:MAG: histidine kinase [Eubacteriales bacterium]|nr:histidine kinase [Eubacteriales bacterium]